MATQMTPEEIQAVFDAYNEALAAGTPITKEMNDRLRDATKGIKDYSATLRSSLKDLGQASKQLGKDLYEGKKGASVFNDSLDKAADAASNMAAGFGPLGIAVGLAVKAFSFFVTQVNKQSDKLYESFQNISRAGAMGAQGMDQVFDSMMKMGYTIDELGNMGEVLKESSKNFGQFSSSVISGTKQFADVANVIQNSDLRAKFFNLGMSVDDINKGIGGYMAQQGRLGKLQTMTQDQVTKGAIAYIKEMETLTRLTGQQREELEAQREQALAVDAFYAAVEDMPADAREQALATYNMLAKENPEIAKEYAANFAGIITGQTDAFLATGGKSMQIFSKEFYMNGGKAADAMDQFGAALAENRDTIKAVTQTGGKFGISLQNTDHFINKKYLKGMQESTDAVEDSLNATEGATKAQSILRSNQIRQAQSMQDLVNLGVNPLTRAMQFLSDAIDALIDIIPGGRAKANKAAAEKAAAAATSGAASGSLMDKIIQVESGGRNTGTQGSSAFGVAQMTKGTFEGLAQKAKPGSSLYGKTFEDMKKDVNLQREALSVLTSQNQSALTGAGVGASDAATYLAHFLGVGGAIRVLQASSGTPLSQVVSPDALAANPGVFGKMSTVDDLKNWADRKMGGGGYAVSGAAGFRGSMSGPMSGYSPNVLMHGNEELSIRPMGGTSNDSAGASEGSISRLIDRVDDLIQVSRAQLSVNEKILKYQQ